MKTVSAADCLRPRRAALVPARTRASRLERRAAGRRTVSRQDCTPLDRELLVVVGRERAGRDLERHGVLGADEAFAADQISRVYELREQVEVRRCTGRVFDTAVTDPVAVEVVLGLGVFRDEGA